MISSDSEDYDSRFQLEAAETDTPEVLYHRSWANTLLARVMAALGAEYESAGKGELFGTLKEKLVEQKGETSNDQAAEALNMTSGAVAVALHRLRKRYRILLRREVSDTLAGDDSDMDVDEEIQQLLAAVR